MNFDAAEKIAAAILYEGYILYPYRPTSIKNRQRWNFGTLYPRAYAEAQRPPEPFSFVSECLLEPAANASANASLDLRIRFLQLMPPQQPSADGALTGAQVGSLGWNEGVERTAEQSGLLISDLTTEPLALDLTFDTTASSAPLTSPNESAHGRVTISVQPLDSGAHKLRIELQNLTSLANGATSSRDEALAQSFVSAHLLLGLSGAQFISLLEPPDRFAADAASCHNTGVFPVLVGDEGERTMMLSSPIILYDYPKIAPESQGDYFDGTEMDEMLALRVLTLTDQEKQEMRDGDMHARRILERTEALTEEHMKKVHGAIRGLRHLEEDAS